MICILEALLAFLPKGFEAPGPGSSYIPGKWCESRRCFEVLKPVLHAFIVPLTEAECIQIQSKKLVDGLRLDP